MQVEKWQALGNDYLIIEQGTLPWPMTPGRAQLLCDPHLGLGADGLLLLAPPTEAGFVARLTIINPDGSEAELSGNGARQAILYLRRAGWTDSREFSIETRAGEIRATIADERTCTMAMGRARLASGDFPDGPDDGLASIEAAGRTWNIQHLQVGNPQAAIRIGSIEELDALDLEQIGPGLEAHPAFPHRTNVSFYSAVAEDASARASSSAASARHGPPAPVRAAQRSPMCLRVARRRSPSSWTVASSPLRWTRACCSR